MKRSEVNELMQTALVFFNKHHFLLPPFATWTAETWKEKGINCAGIIKQQLGWDITDFGSGNFHKTGLLLFTMRNGTFEDLKT